jgi:cellulose synthase/poly-beta-1,6-N-acetylglucosamine synthase-like glycosyltransferase
MYIDTPINIRTNIRSTGKLTEHNSDNEPIIIKKKDDRMLVCITLYNETDLPLLLTLYSVSLAIAHCYQESTISEKISLCIIGDGYDRLSPTALKLFDTLGLLCNKKHDKQIKLYDNSLDPSMLEKILLQRMLMQNSEQKWKLLYKSWLHENREYLPITSKVPIRTLVCLKHENKGKLNSHWWFFRFIGKQINPEFCFQLDTGTMPGISSISALKAFMDKSSNTGAIASRVLVPSGVSWLKPIQAWQYGDFVYQKLFDWPAELMSGYLTVLPGQFCIFRTKALNNHNSNNDNKSSTYIDPLDYYFRGLNQLGAFESNMFLAEDRVLGYEIISKSEKEWRLDFEPSATSITDTCDSLHELFQQRRRWINSAFACNFWLIVKILGFLKNSRSGFLFKIHTIMAVPWLIVNNMAQWFYPTALLIVLSIAFKHLPFNVSIAHFTFNAGSMLLVLFYALILLQVLVFYNVKIFTKHLFIVKLCVAFQSFILLFGALWYTYDHFSVLTGEMSLLPIFVAEMVLFVITAAFYSGHLLKGVIKHIVPYFLFRPHYCPIKILKSSLKSLKFS